MRRRVVALGCALGAAAAGVACVDLFHATQFDTLCDLDASATECATIDAALPDTSPIATPDSAPPPAVDFCAWTPDVARRNAEHACAWLSACEGALGNNQYGPCIVNALLAYDCTVNRNRPVRGATHDYWACLANATSCDAFDACLAPKGKRPCGAFPTPYAQCASVDSGADKDTRNACDPGLDASAPRGVESCAATGQTCAVVDFGSCNGSNPSCRDAGTDCTGTHLRDCDVAGGIDHGIDCASFGEGKCAPGGAACLPSANASTCKVDASITCLGTSATSCPAGREEIVDCRELLGDAGACNPKGSGRAWDATRACTAGTCIGEDSCAGSILRSCARGVTFTVDCAAQGLSPCQREMLPTESVTKARCGKPPSAH